MKITVLTDDIKSWFVPYGKRLTKELNCQGHDALYVHKHKEVREGDICFILSCTRLLKHDLLKLNEKNIVVHASDLPQGKGFSPMQWQILNGSDEICLTLFEANESVDAGPYYIKERISLLGNEVYSEIRKLIADQIIKMCLVFVQNQSNLRPIEMTGEESFFPRRTIQDDIIDPSKSIVELFNHLRIADNDRFPLMFEYKGRRFKIGIQPMDK